MNTNCPHCRTQIESGVTRCPHCAGEIEYENKFTLFRLCLYTAGVFILLLWWQEGSGSVINDAWNAAKIAIVGGPILWVLSDVRPRRG